MNYKNIKSEVKQMEKKLIKVNKKIHDSIKIRAVKRDSTIEQEVNDILGTKLEEDGDLVESE